MRIDGASVATPSADGSPKDRARAAGTAATPEPQGAVVVSKASSELASKISAAGAQTGAAAERLAAIRTQIEAGTYSVDLDRLAERVADEVLAQRGR
jgi:anti-sigma28 factor (negative regulator of flagellin synthesis)